MAKRAYSNGYPSVTEVLNVLRKPALEIWYKINTPQFIKAESAKGLAVGRTIHESIENYISTEEVRMQTDFPDEVTFALKSFALFHKENKSIKLKEAICELPLTSELYKFNGTIDCIPYPLILDWKTGKAKDSEVPPVYDEYKTQTATYVKLYNENNEKKINEALVVPIAKDKVAYNIYRMKEKEIDERFNEIFLPAFTILNYQKKAAFADL